MTGDGSVSLNNDSYILVLGMGGTISGIAQNADKPLNYQTGKVSVENLLGQAGTASLGGCRLVARQVANIDSQNLTDAHLTELGTLVSQALEDPLLKGLVITHGTDTIEETGIFLHLTCGYKARNAAKRIVLTGAMRPSNALFSDGPQNLSDALKWASAALDECPGGVYGVFAGQVCLGMDLNKRHSTELVAPLQDAFCTAIDQLDPSWLAMVRSLRWPAKSDLPIPESDAWPWVEILTSHAGARPETVQHWLGSGVRGLAVAGTGLGGFHAAWASGLTAAAQQGIAIVRCSRTGAGHVGTDIPEVEIDGMAAGGELSAPKARLALQLVLNAVNRSNAKPAPNAWRDLFLKTAYSPKRDERVS